MAAPLVIRIAPELGLFLPQRHRSGSAPAEVVVEYDGTSSIGHVVTSLGIPLTEVGTLLVGGGAVAAPYRAHAGDVVTVTVRPRPQPAPTAPPRFVLDVHLGTLARRLRLLGVDATYRNDAADDELIEEARSQQRVLLTQDRALLRRRVASEGAYVRGSRPDEQLTDVLDRFAPPLQPWTRCTSCNGVLRRVEKAEVLDRLEPGTRRTYEEFGRCVDCGRVFWRGAHSARLDAVVERAVRFVTYRSEPG